MIIYMRLCQIMYLGIFWSCTRELFDHVLRNCQIMYLGIVWSHTSEFYDHIPRNCQIMYLWILWSCTWEFSDYVPGNIMIMYLGISKDRSEIVCHLIFFHFFTGWVPGDKIKNIHPCRKIKILNKRVMLIINVILVLYWYFF